MRGTNPKLQRVFLTGASGFIGSHLLRRLLREGCRITAPVRSAAAAASVRQAGATPTHAALDDTRSLRQALQGNDAIVHAAAHLKIWGTWAEFEQANVGLTRMLLDAARATGVTRFVHLSAASVVMQAPGPMLDVDETAPLTARSELPYSATKAIAETLVLRAAGPDLQTVALRPPFVWGPGDAVDREIGELIARGRFGWFDGGHYPCSTCHVDNLCEAVVLALSAPTSGRAYFITDGHAADFRDFLGRRIRARGLEPPALKMPTRLAWPLATLLEGIWRSMHLRGAPPITREAIRLIGFPFTLDSGRARGELGYRPLVATGGGSFDARAH